MSGFFAIGVEHMRNSRNLGNLFRSANAFGASYAFTIASKIAFSELKKADTSDSYKSLPLYNFPNFEDMPLPVEAKIVAVELLDESEDLPQFHHPKQAVYILGPENGRVSKKTLERCDYFVKIPTKFCINVAMAGALVMYDRIQSLGPYKERPLKMPLRPQFEHEKWFSLHQVEAPEDYYD